MTNLTRKELRKMLDNGEITSQELTQAYLEKIEADNKTKQPINGYITLLNDLALKRAKEADERLKSGERNPYLGIPIAIKDLINIQGAPTTCASKILTGYHSTYDAHVIEQLNPTGIVYLGKTNMDEFAMGSSTESSYYGITRNPHDRDRVPGGSSGGSAAVVAADQSPWSLGSDTGGSIRQPASFCGIYGLKPTYGRVSRYGLVAYASSLDQIGPMGKDAEDLALLLNLIAGQDHRDSTCINKSVPDYTATLNDSIKGTKIGLPKEYFVSGTDKEILDNIKSVVTKLEKEGCIIEEISLPHTEYGVYAYYIIATSEASANLARFDGIRYGHREEEPDLVSTYKKSRTAGFGEEVKRRIMLGTYSLSAGYYDAYYLKAQKVRTLIVQDFKSAFDKVDFILTPTAPTTAFKIGELVDDPVKMYLGDVFTVTINMAGIPGLVMPCGKDSRGLPIGLQILGNYFKEAPMLNLANQIAQIKD